MTLLAQVEDGKYVAPKTWRILLRAVPIWQGTAGSSANIQDTAVSSTGSARVLLEAVLSLVARDDSARDDFPFQRETA